MGTNELLWVRAGAVSSTWAASVHQLETWFGAQEEILAGGIGLCLVYVGRVTRAARGRGQASPGGDSRASKEEDLRLKAETTTPEFQVDKPARRLQGCAGDQ